MPNCINLFMKAETGTNRKRISPPGFRRVTALLLGLTRCVVSCFFVTVATAGSTPEPVAVHVRANAQVKGKEIYLKDIAEITAPAALKEKIGAISLGPAPRPGKEKKILGRRLLPMAQASGLMPRDVKWTVPDSVIIDRACQSVPEEVLQQLYQRVIGDALDGGDYKVRRIKVCGANRFPVGKLSFTVPKSGKQELTGSVNLRVQVQVDGENHGRLILSGWVDHFAPVVCVNRDVARHTVLTEADLCLKTVNVSTLSGPLITNLADAVGKQTRMTLRADGYLRSGMLTVPPLVQKGDRVKIEAGSGKLKVSTMGIAKGSGRMGDQVQVENIVSNKIVFGRVTGEHTVEVMF